LAAVTACPSRIALLTLSSTGANGTDFSIFRRGEVDPFERTIRKSKGETSRIKLLDLVNTYTRRTALAALLRLRLLQQFEKFKVGHFALQEAL
jgi:hypothetical protein